MDIEVLPAGASKPGEHAGVRTWPWVLVVLAGLVAFTSRITFGGGTYFQNGADLASFYYPMRALLGRSLASGRLPLWTSSMYCGFPAQAQGEIASLCPLSWIGPWSDPGHSMSLTIVLALIVGGLGSFRLARVVGLSPAASAVVGLTWALSGQSMMNVSVPAALVSGCFAPLALSFLEESIRRRNPARMLWIAPALTFSFFGGYPQMTYLTVCGLFATLVAAWLMPPADRVPFKKYLSMFILSGVLTALLTGPQLAPMVDYLRQSDRAQPVSQGERAMGSLPPTRLMQWIYPWIDGDMSRLGSKMPEDGFMQWTHAGFLALVGLGLAAAAVRREQGLRRPLALLVVSVFVSFGRHTPVWTVLQWVPGYSLFRNPSRVLFLSELVLALLVGWLVDRLLAKPKISRSMIGALAAVHIGWLASIAWPVLPVLPAGVFPPPQSPVEFIRAAGRGRQYSLCDHEVSIEAYVRAGGWREDLTPYLNALAAMTPNVPVLYGLESAQGHAGLTLPLTDQFSYQISLVRPDVRHPPVNVSPQLIAYFRLLAVRWVVSVRELRGTSLTEVHRTSFPWDGFQIRVYEQAAPGQRARVVGQALPSAGPGGDFRRLGESTHDLNATCLMQGIQSPLGSPGPAGTARVIADGGETLVIDVDASREGFLVVSDTPYPGWRATLDGREVELRTADLICRAVSVPPGRHRVVMRFVPVAFQIGTGMAFVGLLLFIGLAVGSCKVGRCLTPTRIE